MVRTRNATKKGAEIAPFKDRTNVHATSSRGKKNARQKCSPKGRRVSTARGKINTKNPNVQPNQQSRNNDEKIKKTRHKQKTETVDKVIEVRKSQRQKNKNVTNEMETVEIACQQTAKIVDSNEKKTGDCNNKKEKKTRGKINTKALITQRSLDENRQTCNSVAYNNEIEKVKTIGRKLRSLKTVDYHDSSTSDSINENSNEKPNKPPQHEPIYRKKVDDDVAPKQKNVGDVYEFFLDEKDKEKMRKKRKRQSDVSFKVKLPRNRKKVTWTKKAKEVLERLGLNITSKTLKEDVERLIEAKNKSGEEKHNSNNSEIQCGDDNSGKNKVNVISHIIIPSPQSNFKRNESFESTSNDSFHLPVANSTMVNNLNKRTSVPWRVSFPGKYNPHLLKLKTNAMPSVDQEIILDATFNQKTTNNTLHPTTPIKTMAAAVQKSILNFVGSNKNDDENDHSKNNSLFNIDEYSPFKNINNIQGETVEAEMKNSLEMSKLEKTKRNLFNDINNTSTKICIESSQKSDENEEINVESNDVAACFGFDASDEDDLKENCASLSNGFLEAANKTTKCDYNDKIQSEKEDYRTQSKKENNKILVEKESNKIFPKIGNNEIVLKTKNNNIAPEKENCQIQAEKENNKILSKKENDEIELNKKNRKALANKENKIQSKKENKKNLSKTENTKIELKNNDNSNILSKKENNKIEMKKVPYVPLINALNQSNRNKTLNNTKPNTRSKSRMPENENVKENRDGISKFFGFTSFDESSETDNKQNSSKPETKNTNAKPTRIPVVFLVNILKKIDEKEAIFIDEFSRYSGKVGVEKENSFSSDDESENENEDGEDEESEVPLFVDLKPKLPNKSYQRNCKKHRRRQSVASEYESNYDEIVHKDKKAKNNEWTDEAENWAKKFNSMCQEVETYELEVE